MVMMKQVILKGYKSSDVGLIPEDWEAKSLGDLGECIIGLTYKPDNVREYGVLVLRSSNVADGRLTFDDNVYVDVGIPERIRVKKGDILICVRNGSRALIGKCALLNNQVEGQTFGAFMSVFRTKDSEYIFHQFQSDNIQRQIHENIGATINQITNKNLKAFVVPYPNDSQERDIIAQCLSEADALIASLEKLIAKKRAIKQGTMQEFLTGKKRLPGFSEKWETRTLEEYIKVKHGKSQRDVIDEDGLYPILATGGVIGRSRHFLYDKPSVLIGRKGTIDVPQFMATPFWSIDTLFYTEISAYADAKFVYYKFKLIDWYSYNEASGVPSLNASTIEKIESRFPPAKDEQSAIAQVLSDMDAEIEELEQKLDKYKAIKQGMMQELLTGKTRLI